MKTPKRIMVLAADTLAGHRAAAHQEFRAIVAANGYQMSRGGWVTFGGEHVCRGWEAFAYMVHETKEIVLKDTDAAKAEPTRAPLDVVAEPEPMTVADVARVFDVPAELLAAPIDLEPTAEELAPAPRVVYFYTTRTHTIPLSECAEVTTVIQDEATAETEGPCESGAALNCEGSGFLRVLPESLLGGQAERIIQCQPCYEVSAQAYARKAHHYAEPAE